MIDSINTKQRAINYSIFEKFIKDKFVYCKYRGIKIPIKYNIYDYSIHILVGDGIHLFNSLYNEDVERLLSNYLTITEHREAIINELL